MSAPLEGEAGQSREAESVCLRLMTSELIYLHSGNKIIMLNRMGWFLLLWF